MAAVSLARGSISTGRRVLVANATDDITFKDEVSQVEVLVDGTAWVFVSTDGSAAAVDGADCYPVPPAGGWTSIVVSVSDRKVSVVSPGTPTYVVTRA